MTEVLDFNKALEEKVRDMARGINICTNINEADIQDLDPEFSEMIDEDYWDLV